MSQAQEFFSSIKAFAEEVHNNRMIDRDSIFYKIGFDGDQHRLGWVVAPEEDALGEWLDKAEFLLEKQVVLFVGMGGSINTIKMLKQILNIDNAYSFDNPDRELIIRELEEIKQRHNVILSDIFIVAISKSATTYETHEIAKILKSIYEKEGLDIYEKMLWIIDMPNKGQLESRGWDLSKMRLLPIQVDGSTDIGGRFTSPRTALFLLPALLYLRDKSSIIKMMRWLRDWEMNSEFQNRVWEFGSLVIPSELESNHPFVCIVMPESLSSAYEPVRVWTNQLFQESLGGKVKGFDPKTYVAFERELSELYPFIERFNMARIETGVLDELASPSSDIERLAIINLSLEYVTAIIAYRYSRKTGEILNFVTQPNVQLYKQKMKSIDEVSSGHKIGLDEIIPLVRENLKDGIKFVELVYYGPDNSVYENLKNIGKGLRTDVLELVFRGPDWNHHAFQAAPMTSHTLFVIVVDERADLSVKKVAQATVDVLRDYDVSHLYLWI